MRLLIFILFCLSFSTHSFAQLKNGLRLGTNLSWYNQTVDPVTNPLDGSVNEYTSQYTPNMGFQVGYLWRIGVSKRVSFSIEAMLGLYSMDVKYTGFDFFTGSVISKTGSIILYGASAPICINYSIAKNWFLSAGYEAMFNNTGNATLVHMVTYGGGLHTKFGDFTLRMTQSLNSAENYDTRSGQIVSSDNTNMQSELNKYERDERYLHSVQLTYTLPIKSGYRKLKEQDGK